MQPHYLTPETGLGEGLVAVQRIGKDQLLPRESVGVVDGLNRKPVAVTVLESLPAQAVAGSRVDVWVALPDAGNGFNEPTLLLPGAEIAEITAGSTALGSSRSTVVMVLVSDAQMPKLLGAQANKAKISVVWNPGGGIAMNIPVVTVGHSRDDLVGGLERLHGPVSVVRRCGELAELLAACQSGLARAAVVAEGSEALTASMVDRLSAVGVAVVALTDSAAETSRLHGIGVAAELRGVDPAALALRISAAVAELGGAGPRPYLAADGAFADPGPGPRPAPARCRSGRCAGRRGQGDHHCRLGASRLAGQEPAGGQYSRGTGRGREIRHARRR